MYQFNNRHYNFNQCFYLFSASQFFPSIIQNLQESFSIISGTVTAVPQLFLGIFSLVTDIIGCLGTQIVGTLVSELVRIGEEVGACVPIKFNELQSNS